MIFSRVNKTDGKSDDEQLEGGTELCRGTKEVSVYMLGVFGVAMAHQQLKLETRPPQKQTDLLQRPEMTAIRLTSK